MKNKILVAVIVVLVAAVAVLAYYNQKSIANKDQAADNPSLLVKAGGVEIATIDLERIKTLGEEEFETTLRSSGKPARDHVFRGVPLYKILQAADPDILQQGDQVVVKAIDAYVVAYTVEEVLRDEHIYVVYEQDGQPLGSKSGGGSGPLLAVARQDEFGQRWCKFLVEVEVQ